MSIVLLTAQLSVMVDTVIPNFGLIGLFFYPELTALADRLDRCS